MGYGYYQQFYRAGALEMKRLDSMLRSLLYSHLSESLTGKYRRYAFPLPEEAYR